MSRFRRGVFFFFSLFWGPRTPECDDCLSRPFFRDGQVCFLERVEETLLHFKTKLFEGGIQPLEVGNEQGP